MASVGCIPPQVRTTRRRLLQLALHIAPSSQRVAMLLVPTQLLYALHLMGWFYAPGLFAVVGMFYGIAGMVVTMALVNADLKS